ncbi:MAG: 1-deoxy-D-xylulose-5-phosphate reductoisomerase [Oscillospiraceae bacterium]|nr:1-deoxy-D-xylulose-5-phosphate reductoisomerase [Oscillospiraceae bacterium]
MRSAISLLGSTGSIGRQTLEAVDFLGLRVLAISAGKNTKLLEEQARRFRPAIAAAFDESAAQDFRLRVRDLDIRVVSGVDGLIETATVEGAGTVVVATAGTAGLLPTFAAIKLGRRIALANKEILVCAGDYIMSSAREYGAEVIPVDSEHSAIFQCLRAEARLGVKKLILTASGGPFRGMSRLQLQNVSPEMALRHPNWSMGVKTTVDSATLMNKGLEIIEAMHLFAVMPERIGVVVHPESIVHSMVEFADNSITAQLSLPDMRLPIQFALTYPDRLPSLVEQLDLTRLSTLTFEQPDMDAFPCLNVAIEAASVGGTAGAALNGADEAAVELFLSRKLSFYGIYESICEALDKFGNIGNPSLEEIIAVVENAKEFVHTRYGDGFRKDKR